MAKKAAPPESPPESPEDLTDRIFSQIEQAYGAGILVAGSAVVDDHREVIPVSPSLDIILGGGIREGSWFGITGNPAFCKTSVALSFAANAQQRGRPVYYAKVEGRFSPIVARGTRGLSLEKGAFNVIQSREGRVLTAQDYLTILSQIIRSVPGAVVIIDSISSLCDERELTDGVGTETRGGGAKLFSQFCRTLANTVPVQRTIVIGITHLISNTSGMGAQYVERAARMWTYQCDYAIRATQRSPWEAGAELIGYLVKWACNKTAGGYPGRAIDSHVRFGVGLDKVYELIQLGLGCGLVKKSGAWFSLPFLATHGVDEEVKAQGGERLYDLLVKNPQWATWLEEEVGKLGGAT